MDGVPVKIAERYKPPPRLYQLSQSVLNKLSLSVNHYNDPQFCYDFQLERKVLAKIPDWQRMRQLEREARLERKQKREQQRMRELEVHQKQLLGAVSYPSAEDLSSTGSEDESISVNSIEKTTDETQEQEETTILSNQTCSFHNILQPTILSNNDSEMHIALAHAGNVLNASKLTHTFNYKDFEEDTSSPFDNIELKTINDLDMLAQVLHDTQLKVDNQQREQPKENPCNKETLTEPNSNNTEEESITVETAKAVLERVDFEPPIHNENENIPTSIDNASYLSAMESQQNLSNSYNTYTSAYTPYKTQAAIAYSTPYNQFYNNGSDQLQYPNYQYAAYSNQNLMYAANCNGGSNVTTAYFSPTHATQFVSPNPHTHDGGAHLTAKTGYYSPPQPCWSLQVQADLNSKSKSVPDILKELSDEVHNSKMRRTRNHSQNMDDSKEAQVVEPKQETPALQIGVKSRPYQTQQMQSFGKLEASVQKLTRNISSMGFPLERVAKIAEIFGTDDKKIIEHLIPLSELMDLGFEETKISEALMKFDNNKEKALEYLIS